MAGASCNWSNVIVERPMALEEKGQGLSNSPPCRAVRTASALTSGSRPKNRCWQAVKKSRIPVPNSMRHQRRLPDTGRWQRGYCRTKTRSAAQSVLYRASLHEFVGFSHSAQCHEKRTRQQSMQTRLACAHLVWSRQSANAQPSTQ